MDSVCTFDELVVFLSPIYFPKTQVHFFLTQGQNLALLHFRQILYHLSYQGSPKMYLFPSPGIFPTQGSNLGLPHCRQLLYHLSHQGSPDPQNHDQTKIVVYVTKFWEAKFKVQWITRVKYHQATILYQKCLLWELGIYKKWQWVARLEREFRPDCIILRHLGFFPLLMENY